MPEIQTVRLDELITQGAVQLGRGDVISKDDIAEHPGPYPIYSSSAQNNGKFGEYGKYMFDEELITWSVDGGGHFFYRDRHQFSVTNVCGFMRVNDKRLYPKFVFYSLAHQHRSLTFDYTDKAHPSVIRKQYRLPDIGMTLQKQIASILTGIDTSIEKTEALIAKHQQIKAGLMHDLFTRGVLPNGQLRPPRSEAPELYQETAMGWIPRGWSLSDCGREFAIDSGITLGPHRRPDRNARPYLRVANVHRDELRLEDLAYLEELAGDADLPLREKDLLVVEGHANRMEIGRCAMVTEAAVGMLFQNHLFRLRPQRLVSEFALDWLNSHHAQSYWDTTCSTSSGLNTINRKMLGRLPVLVPPADEQTRIVRAVSVAKCRIEGEAHLLDKLSKQKLGLMQDLLTGRVPVPAAPEPAEAHA